MTTPSMAKSTVAMAALATLTSALLAPAAFAQSYPVTPTQRDTATQVAKKGVPLSEISANAPERYTIKSGDTLWAISRMYLKSPWRWPELWGMNMDQIKNPHLIYPGQVLILERKNGLATLRLEGSTVAAPTEPEQPDTTVRVSPRTRYESLPGLALPTLNPSVIEAFLAEPIVVDEEGLKSAPRIVSAQESRVLLTRGDRAYALGQNGKPLLDDQVREKRFRLFHNVTPLKDPGTGEILGYEAQYVGKATLASGESTAEVEEKDGKFSTATVPAAIDIISAKSEIVVGDRLLPEPERVSLTYTPHVPANSKLTGRIVSVYGSAIVNAAQNQVVAINLGTRDGMAPGHVMVILKDGARVIDKTDEARPLLKLPDERNGLLMVFRTFERVSYALILEITDGVRVGDRLNVPR